MRYQGDYDKVMQTGGKVAGQTGPRRRMLDGRPVRAAGAASGDGGTTLATRHAATARHAATLDRALGILRRMATEQTGWRGVLRRWYYADEPLRNDAANLLREAGSLTSGGEMPAHTRLVGGDGADGEEAWGLR